MNISLLRLGSTTDAINEAISIPSASLAGGCWAGWVPRLRCLNYSFYINSSCISSGKLARNSGSKPNSFAISLTPEPGWFCYCYYSDCFCSSC